MAAAVASGKMQIEFALVGVKRIKQFRSDVYNYTIRLSGVSIEHGQCFNVIEAFFQQVVITLLNEIEELDPTDQVRFTVLHPALNTPLNLQYKSASAWTGDEITLAIAKIIQSGKHIALDDGLVIHIFRTRNVIGGGKRKQPEQV